MNKCISSILNLIIVSSFLFSGMMKPSDGQFISYVHVLFEWDQEPDAISYNIQVSRFNQFTNLLIDLDTPDLVYIHKDQNISWNNTYYWHQPSYCW